MSNGHLTLERVSSHLDAHYTLTGRVVRLPGEHDENYLVTTPDARFVFRVVARDQDPSRSTYILSLLQHLAASDIRAPRIVPTSDGEATADIPDPGGVSRVSWLATYVEGVPFLEHLGDPLVCGEVGRALARLDLHLAAAPTPKDPGSTPWDLTRPEGALALIEGVPLRGEDDRIRRYLHDLVETTVPAMTRLDRQPIHNDANPDNVLLGSNGVIGMIDFGDALVAPRVVELAVAGSYLVAEGHPSNAQSPVTSLIRSYGEISPVSELEASLLPSLMRGRIALAMGNACARAFHYPERADYVLRYFDRARQRLDALEAWDQATAAAAWTTSGRTG